MWLLLAAVAVHAPGRALAAQPDSSELNKAEALATEAKVFFKARLFERAAQRYMEAFAVSRRPALMYNAARAYEEGRQFREAHALFQEYRKLADVSDDGRKDADGHIASLEAELQAADRLAAQRKVEARAEPKFEPRVEPKIEPPEAKQQAKVEPRAEAARPPIVVKPALPPERKWPVVQLAAGGGALAVSLVTYLLARSEADAARATPIATVQDVNTYADHESNAKTLRSVSIGSLAVGLALATWAAYDVSRAAAPDPVARSEASGLRLETLGGGAQLVWSRPL